MCRLLALFAACFSINSFAVTTLMLTVGDYELTATLDARGGSMFNGTLYTQDPEVGQCRGEYTYDLRAGELTLKFTDPEVEECTIHNLEADVAMADFMSIMRGNEVEIIVRSAMFDYEERTGIVRKLTR